jgi:hypothetical protein
VQACLALPGGRVVVDPRTEFEPAPVVAGAEDQDVALAEPDALGLLRRLQFSSTPRPTSPLA